MGTQKAATLSQFFSLTREACLERLSKVYAEGDAGPKERLQKTASTKWSLVLERIVDHLPGMLDIPIPEIVARAWSGYKELHKYRDRDTYPPGETFLLPTAKHTIRSEHHPVLEIRINGKEISKIEFTVSVALLLDGLILKVQDARIKEIIIGSCAGEGSIMCQKTVILTRKSPSIYLPESVNLGEGIPIVSVDDIGKGRK